MQDVGTCIELLQLRFEGLRYAGVWVCMRLSGRSPSSLLYEGLGGSPYGLADDTN